MPGASARSSTCWRCVRREKTMKARSWSCTNGITSTSAHLMPHRMPGRLSRHAFRHHVSATCQFYGVCFSEHSHHKELFDHSSRCCAVNCHGSSNSRSECLCGASSQCLLPRKLSPVETLSTRVRISAPSRDNARPACGWGKCGVPRCLFEICRTGPQGSLSHEVECSCRSAEPSEPQVAWRT